MVGVADSSLGHDFITDIIPILTLAVGVAALAVPYLAQRLSRPSFHYSIDAGTQLVRSISGAPPGIHVMLEDQILEDPRLYQVRLALRGRGEVVSDDFDRKRPIKLILHVPIISLTQVTMTREYRPEPRVKISEDAIQIGPDLLRRRLEIVCTVLVNGPGAMLDIENPVQGVDEKQEQLRDEISRTLTVQRILGWIAIILIVVWILSNPAGAGSTVHAWITGIVDFFAHIA